MPPVDTGAGVTGNSVGENDADGRVLDDGNRLGDADGDFEGKDVGNSVGENDSDGRVLEDGNIDSA